jgi:hypothetical protein
MAKQVRFVQILQENTTKLGVLEKMLDYIITNNKGSINVPGPSDISKMIRDVHADLDRAYPSGTVFVP